MKFKKGDVTIIGYSPKHGEYIIDFGLNKLVFRQKASIHFHGSSMSLETLGWDII